MRQSCSLAHPPRRRGTRVGGGLDRAHLAADEHRHQPGRGALLAEQPDLGGLDHRVTRLDRTDETLGLDHSQRIVFHGFLF